MADQDDLKNTLSEIDVGTDEDLKPTKIVKQAPAEIFQDQFQRVLSKYGEVIDDIVLHYKKDREQAQRAIDLFMDVVEAGGKVPRVYVEKLPDIIKVKNEIAQTGIKALDSITKLMAASKNNDMVNNNTNSAFDTSDLAKLLDDIDD